MENACVLRRDEKNRRPCMTTIRSKLRKSLNWPARASFMSLISTLLFLNLTLQTAACSVRLSEQSKYLYSSAEDCAPSPTSRTQSNSVSRQLSSGHWRRSLHKL